MKSTIKKVLKPFIQNDLTWGLLKPLTSLGNFMRYERTVIENRSNFDYLFKDSIVQHGPFKGLLYPSLHAGDLLYPKLIGCYEKELHGLVEKLCAKDYKQILNIGCAEGYYAVGMAKRMPHTRIYAYDIDDAEQDMCRKMATLNDVADKVAVGDVCTAFDLENRSFEEKTLIVCDCEGAEKDLFTPQNIPNLKHCDLLIELHDCIDISISTYITNLLQKTHNLQFIKSIDDIEKAKTYNYPIAKHLTLSEKKRLYSEGRVSIMEWVMAWAKE